MKYLIILFCLLVCGCTTLKLNDTDLSLIIKNSQRLLELESAELEGRVYIIFDANNSAFVVWYNKDKLEIKFLKIETVYQ